MLKETLVSDLKSEFKSLRNEAVIALDWLTRCR